jgi:hypothetical protein
MIDIFGNEKLLDLGQSGLGHRRHGGMCMVELPKQRAALTSSKASE